MITLQSVFVVIVMLLLCGLVLDGLLTRSVWVKGSRSGIFSFRNMAHKRGREDEPRSYLVCDSFLFSGDATVDLVTDVRNSRLV